MLAAVQTERGQPRLKQIETTRFTAFVAATTSRNGTVEQIARKAALIERLNAIMAQPDENSRQAGWNAVKADWSALKLAPEGNYR